MRESTMLPSASCLLQEPVKLVPLAGGFGRVRELGEYFALLVLSDKMGGCPQGTLSRSTKVSRPEQAPLQHPGQDLQLLAARAA